MGTSAKPSPILQSSSMRRLRRRIPHPHRCLDNAIADAVSSFSAERDTAIANAQEIATNERLGFLIRELRNSLSTAMLATSALELESLPISGATGAVPKRSHSGLKTLMDAAILRSAAQIRGANPDARFPARLHRRGRRRRAALRRQRQLHTGRRAGLASAFDHRKPGHQAAPASLAGHCVRKSYSRSMTGSRDP